MVPVSTIRPCLLKCLFKTHTTESVLHHKMQTPTTLPTVVAHNDSSWFTLPLCGNCSTVSLNLSAELLGRRSVLRRFGRRERICFLQLIDTCNTCWEQLYLLGSSVTHQWTVSVEMFLIPLLYYAAPPPHPTPPDSSSPYGQMCARMWGWLFWAHHISRRSIFTAPAGTLETA